MCFVLNTNILNQLWMPVPVHCYAKCALKINLMIYMIGKIWNAYIGLHLIIAKLMWWLVVSRMRYNLTELWKLSTDHCYLYTCLTLVSARHSVQAHVRLWWQNVYSMKVVPLHSPGGSSGSRYVVTGRIEWLVLGSSYCAPVVVDMVCRFCRSFTSPVCYVFIVGLLLVDQSGKECN